MRVIQPERHLGLYPRGITYNAGGIGPHALVQRASYTVPSDEHVRIEGASIAVGQESMPTSGGLIQAYIDDSTRDILGLVWTDLSALSNPAPVAVGFAGYYTPGSVFRIFTSDASVGSRVTYRISLRLMVMS